MNTTAYIEINTQEESKNSLKNIVLGVTYSSILKLLATCALFLIFYISLPDNSKNNIKKTEIEKIAENTEKSLLNFSGLNNMKNEVIKILEYNHTY